MKTQVMNPYLPLCEYVPDAEPRIFGDRLYVYGSHDQAGGTEFCMNDYVVWSAPLSDLGVWKYEGVSYSYESTGATLQEAGNLAAPDCVRGPDGRYYLYYNRGARFSCEIAVSDMPQGPFTYLANVTYSDGTEPAGKQFDPGVLIDDDARIYLYTGFVPTPGSPWINVAGRYSYGFELEPDMYTIKQGPIEVLPGCLASKDTPFEGHGFYEASSPRKINGKYYIVYSSEQSHDLCYAVSDFPLKGYEYGGILVSNADIGYESNKMPKAPYGNTHGGLVQIGAQWYVFYHRQTHGIECCRQGCAEPIQLDENGVFHQAEMTSCGLNGAPLRGQGTYNAAYACNLMHDTIGKERLTIRNCVRETQPHIFEAQNVHFIANMQNGTVVGFKYFALGEASSITIRLKATQSGNMQVYLEEACVRLAATIQFSATEDWTDFAAEFSAPRGTYPLYFELACNGTMSWMQFTLA